jgi:hypothetical protein
MKTQAEIQKAHDILHFLTADPDRPVMLNKEAAIAAHAVHDALGWILGFDCGVTFAENLKSIQQGLRELGYQEVDFGRVLSPEEQKRRGL